MFLLRLHLNRRKTSQTICQFYISHNYVLSCGFPPTGIPSALHAGLLPCCLLKPLVLRHLRGKSCTHSLLPHSVHSPTAVVSNPRMPTSSHLFCLISSNIYVHTGAHWRQGGNIFLASFCMLEHILEFDESTVTFNIWVA